MLQDVLIEQDNEMALSKGEEELAGLRCRTAQCHGRMESVDVQSFVA